MSDAMRKAFGKTTVLFGGQPVTSYWNEDKGAYEIDWVQNDFECFCEGWQAAQSVPGFVLVPVEPTEEMILAGQDCIVGSRTSVVDVWQAMVKAQENQNGNH